MGHAGPLWIFVSLGITEVLGFSVLSVYTELSCSKPIRNILNYASSLNIEEVFETDFSTIDEKNFLVIEEKLGKMTSF